MFGGTGAYPREGKGITAAGWELECRQHQPQASPEQRGWEFQNMVGKDNVMWFPANQNGPNNETQLSFHWDLSDAAPSILGGT